MHHMQGNFKLWPFGTLALAGMLFCTLPAHSAGIARPTPADPLLDGGPSGPCEAHTDSPDYVAGTDAGGHPVPPADLEAGPAPVPANLAVPLKGGRGRNSAYVQVDGKKLDSLLNPPAACPGPKPASPRAP
jgi:hypothetical protein